MTRKNSSCKLWTLIRRCSFRQGALFAVSVVLLLCAQPVNILLNIQNNQRYFDSTDAEQRANMLEYVRSALLTNDVAVLALPVLAIVAGIALFRYLHVKNQTDFFHALPVTRGQLFLSHMLTGILIIVPPYVIGTLLSCAVVSANGFGEILSASDILSSMVVHISAFLLFYAIAVLSAVLCGHTTASVLVCGWLLLGLYPISHVGNALLALLYPARMIADTATSVWVSPAFGAYHMIVYQAGIRSVLICLAMAISAFVLSYVLNNLRRSENAGLPIAFPVVELPFKFYMMTVISILCGLIFESMTGKWSMMFFGMAISALITSCVVEIIYDLDFHSLFRRWKSLLAYCAVCAVILCGMSLDITGWNSRLPVREDIVSADLISNVDAWDCSGHEWNNGLTDYTLGDFLLNISPSNPDDYSLYSDETALSGLLDYITDEQQLQDAENIDLVYTAAQLGADAMKENRSTLHYDYQYTGDTDLYSVRFTLKNGKTFTRKYYLSTDCTEMTEATQAIRASAEYLDTRTPEATAQKNKSKARRLSVVEYTDTTYQHLITNGQAISDILDTLKQESAAHPDTSYQVPVLMLHVSGQYAAQSEDEDSSIYSCMVYDDAIDIAVYAYEEKTLALLQTYADFMPENFTITDILRIDIEEELDEDVVSHSYTEKETLEKILPGLLPVSFASLMDSETATTSYTACVHLKSGDDVYCTYYPKLAADLSELNEQ